MDDLNEKINRLLSDPEGMAKIQSMMAALGGGESAAPPPPPPAPSPAPAGGPDLTALTRLLPLLTGAGEDNEDTRLLAALKPYLHGERTKRLDESMRLLRLAKLLPVLQEQGILGGGGGGG